jgi:hypothetical protein
MLQQARANLRLIVVCVGLTLLLSPVLLPLLAGVVPGAGAQAASTAAAPVLPAPEVASSATAALTWTPAATPTATARPGDHLVLATSVGEVVPGASLGASIVLLSSHQGDRLVTITTRADPGLVLDAISGADCAVTPSTGTCTTSISAGRPVHLTAQVRVERDAPAGQLRLWAEATDTHGLEAHQRGAVTVRSSAQAPAGAPVLMRAAQVELTPILGTAVVVTPIHQPSPGPDAGVGSGATGEATGSPDAGDARPQAPATPAPRPGAAPDACEENDTLLQPCALPSEVATTELNFVDDSVDVFSFLLKADRSYTVRASSERGINPVITAYLAGAGNQPIAQSNDVQPGATDAQVEIATSADGWYIVKVENRAPGPMPGRTYTLSVRSAPRGGTATPVADSGASQPVSQLQGRGDAFENNWSLETAGYLGWAVPYDLSLVCPEAGACRDGDHDFFRVQVKRGVPFVAATYDLGPGSDTTIAMYRPLPGFTDPSTGLSGWQLVQHNDDVTPGYTLRSEVQWLPDWDGEALIIVAASDRQDAPSLPATAGPAGRYRLIAGSAMMPAVLEVLQAQQDGPPIPTLAPAALAAAAPAHPAPVSAAPAATATPPPTSTPAPQAEVAPVVASVATDDEEELIRETCLTGAAEVISDSAVFYAAAMPRGDDRKLITYPKGASVELIGSCYGGWVKVRPAGAVTPGYMWAPNLALVEASAASAAQANPASPDSEGGAPATATPAALTTPLQVIPVAPEPVPPAAAPQREKVSVTVTITDADGRGRGGMRVQLANVFGDLVGEANTAQNGMVTISGDAAPGTALRVVVPALGVDVPVRNGQQIPIALPE